MEKFYDYSTYEVLAEEVAAPGGSTCTCEKCMAEAQVGGFRIKEGDTVKWVKNVVQEVAEGPRTEFEEFYIETHDKIVASGVPNFAGERIPVPTRLNIEEWKNGLVDYDDPGLLGMLEYGFPLGYNSNNLPASVIKNHQGAVSFSESVDVYLKKEVDQGLVIGPLSWNPLNTSLAISPLNTVAKKGVSERRVISDFSFPASFSVNDGISKEEYLGDSIDLHYPTVDNLASMLQTHGKGCHMFKRDLKKAYRQFLIDPGDIHLTGYMWKDKLFLDLALVMGSRSAAYLCQKVTNAVSFMAAKEGVNLINYLDDLASVSSPELSCQNFQKVSSLLNRLGLVESEEKAVPPGTRVEFLGILFDSVSQTMEITEDRLIEIKALVKSWLDRNRASKRELQSLIGKLVFVGKCVYSSRIFICRLLATLRGLKHQNHRFKISSEFRKDLQWWDAFIDRFNGVTFIPQMIWADPDVLLSTDACLSGSGGWSGTQFFSCAFPHFVMVKKFHINILELLTILVAFRLWSSNVINKRIKIYCDNESSVCLLNSGKGRDPIMLAIVREISNICTEANCQIRAVHLKGVNNRRADLFSRAPADPSISLSEFDDWQRLQVEDSMFSVSNAI